MRKISVIAIAVAALSLTSNCAALRDLQIENPNYVIRDVRPRLDIAIPFSASSVDLDFLIEVQNPNDVGLRLDGIDFGLAINGSHILDGNSNQRIQIPANGTGDVRLRTRFGYNNVKTLFSEIVDLVRGERARYELEGRAHYDTPIGRMSFPFTIYSTARR